MKEDLEDCIISYDRSSGEPDGAPKGYKYVDAARKKDICWDLMKQLTVEEVERDTRSVSLRLHPMTRLGSVL